MRTIAAMTLCAALCGCSILSRASIAASTASLACDWGQTRSGAEDGWRHYYEVNPILGRSPSTTTVDLYFAAVAAANVVAWHLIPDRWRWVLPTLITARQLVAIRRNTPVVGFCGLGS